MKTVKLALIAALILGLFALTACDDDGDGGTTTPPEAKAWHGVWLSAEENVAPILVTVFNYDSVRVTMRDDNTVTLETHVDGGAWSTTEGTYSVTETEKTGILAISLVYAAFSQEGIVQVTDGLPDILKLEVVQTEPDIGAVPRTPESGFGSDATLGDANIQYYEREDEVDPWLGEWLSADDDVAPILVAVFNYDSVRVTMDPDMTVTLETHVAEGAWSSVEGVYSITRTPGSDVHSISLVYAAFSQEGIVQVVSGNPVTMNLEVVQTEPDIGAVPRTPESGFGSDAALGNTNIQVYRMQ